jgi:hypothetical protein
MPHMKITAAEIRKYLGLLEQTPPSIESLVAGLDESQLRWSHDKREWSAVENLAHLRACADLWTYSIYAMLAENEPTLALLDERRWAKTARYASFPFHESFRVFSIVRAQLLQGLRDLPEPSWSRSALIGDRRHTVFSQVRRMGLHEADHLQQIETLLKDVPRAT